MNDLEFLSTVSQLTGLDPSELEAIREEIITRQFGAGEVILEEGTVNQSFHVIREGRARVERKIDGRDVALCDLVAGQTFGELSILGDGLVTATVRAVTPVAALALSSASLELVLRGSPRAAAKFWQAVATDLRDRLVQTNEVVRNYVEVNRALVENPAFREAYALCNR
ncbi:MAG TPA: cyclic nucleotide-binding domain-containing protein [Thermoanaerobaculia bacterium]|nr:cyclic nucleotide-binding domain-containing protein [Thermoanaerobaculia bacterium]